MIRVRIFARIVWLVVLLWSKTLTFRLANKEIKDRLDDRGENSIYAFWHGSLLLLLHGHYDSRLLIPVSESRDGEFITQVIKNFGFEVARGSSKRKGDKALLSLISNMRKGDRNIGITVDGPRGPLHKVKKGVVFLAAISKAPIVPVAVAAKRAWIPNRSWDKLIVPLPFTKGLVMLGEPFYINSTSEEDIEFGQKKLEAELQRLTKQAQDQVAAADNDAHIPGQDERTRVR
jgi:lysophospholipid acyltransferase (LPLAT)-like uncharacterized protein